MNKFDETYKHICLEIKYRDMKQHMEVHGSIPSFQAGVIYQDCAFHKLPRKFADFLISQIKQMKQKQQFEKQIDIRDALKLIKKQQVENFDQFFNFIQMLSNSSQKILTIQFGEQNSYTQPIQLAQLSTKEIKKIFYDGPYKQDLMKKVKNKSLSAALKLMKQNLDGFSDLGKIMINPNTITNDKYEYDNDDNIIGHQIRHFIIFLQRWSAVNYEVCKKYSNQNFKEYDRNNVDFKVYCLHQDQFITLSSTLIERLVNIFLKDKRSLRIQQVNLLIKSVLAKSKNYPIENLNNDFYWFNLLDANDKNINSIIQFYKNILNDKKYKIQSKINKFDTLINWTYTTFNQKIQQLKDKRKNEQV